MNCPNCGTFLEEGVRFCPVCGSQAVSGSEFVSLNPMPETAQPAEMLSPQEMFIRQNEEKTVNRYKGLLVFSLILAILFVAGAVYMAAFFKMPEKPVESQTDILPVQDAGIVGSWANDDGFIIFTSSGRFAADDMQGSYTLGESLLIMDYGDYTAVSEYALEGDKLTLTVSRPGTETGYTYYRVSEETNLTYSQITELWESMDN